jgi:hypothetical protein
MSALIPTNLVQAFSGGDHSHLPPVCLTYDQLQAAVQPLIETDKWAQDTLGDLWRMGAPMPPALTGLKADNNKEIRLLIPSAFMKWIVDVLERRGDSLDAAAAMYADFVIKGS